MIEFYPVIRSVVLLSCFCFLTFILFRKEQKQRENWAFFYASLWILFSLPIINLLCVKLGFWSFTGDYVLSLPPDLYFIWLVIWGVIVPFFAKGKYLLLSTLILFWIDILLMPQLEKANVLVLNDYWLVGEVFMILVVLIPSFLWFKISYYKQKVWLRAVFQFLVMGQFILIIIPFVVHQYFPFSSDVLVWKPYIFQLIFIVSLPGIIAVKDLVQKGKGTPFPYDFTQRLVRSGVYAYIKNPIQWSFTLVFVPMAIGFESWWLLFGSLVSVLYTLGVANIQEFEDMETRFGNTWTEYKENVPSWRFLWKPEVIPTSVIYFKEDCSFCQEVRTWFEKKECINLEFKHAQEHQQVLTQVTLVNEHGDQYKSVEAIATALEHINLAWASLAWFIRLPGVLFVVQAIIDSMDLESSNSTCEI